MWEHTTCLAADSPVRGLLSAFVVTFDVSGLMGYLKEQCDAVWAIRRIKIPGCAGGRFLQGRIKWKARYSDGASSAQRWRSVSYTHLTLPTILLV